MPKTSVIIPTYNRAELLCKAIESVLYQTFSDFEIIVVDDGSTDNTRDMVNKYHDSRIKYIYQNNQGVAAARNTGIKASSSEYISFLDSDDMYTEKALETSLRYMESNPTVGFCYGQCHLSRISGEIFQTRTSPFHDKSSFIESLTQIRELLFTCAVTLSTITVRRSCIEEIGGFDPTVFFYEDVLMYIRLSKKYPAFYIAEPLAVQRFHGNQLRNIIKPRKERAFLLILQEIFEDPEIAPHFTDVKGKAYCYYYRVWMVASYWNIDMKLVRKYIMMAIRVYPRILLSRQSFQIYYRYFTSFLPKWLQICFLKIKQRFANVI